MTRAQLFLIEPFVLVLLFGVGWVFAPHLRRVLTSLDRQSNQRIGLGIIAVAWAWPWCFGSPTHEYTGFLERGRRRVQEGHVAKAKWGTDMPAAVLVVHDEQSTRELAVSALRAAFLEAVGFADPMAALDAIEASSHVRVLVTHVMFGRDKLNGIAFARMILVKRPAIKVVFVALEEYARHAEGLGVFLPMPLNPDIFVATVSRLLVARDDDRQAEVQAYVQ